MFYVIETQYVGPHSREAAYVDASTIEISTTPAVKNSSREACVDGWCGTTGDWSVYAHGAYATLEEAKNAIAEKFGAVRETDDVAVYKLGKYIPISAEDSVSYAWDGISADVRADTTDEEIDALLMSYEAIANEAGVTLDTDAIRDAMEEHRASLQH